MSNQFLRGQEFALGDQVTAQKLMDVVDKANLLKGAISEQPQFNTGDFVDGADEIIVNDVSDITGTKPKKVTISNIFEAGINSSFGNININSITSDKKLDVNFSTFSPVVATNYVYASNDIVSVSSPAHGLVVGDFFEIVCVNTSGDSGTKFSGLFRVHSETTNLFTYVVNIAVLPSTGSATWTRKPYVNVSGAMAINGDLAINGSIVSETGNINIGTTTEFNKPVVFNEPVAVSNDIDISGDLNGGILSFNGTAVYGLYQVADENGVKVGPFNSTTANDLTLCGNKRWKVCWETDFTYTKPEGEIWCVVFRMNFAITPNSPTAFVCGMNITDQTGSGGSPSGIFLCTDPYAYGGRINGGSASFNGYYHDFREVTIWYPRNATFTDEKFQIAMTGPWTDNSSTLYATPWASWEGGYASNQSGTGPSSIAPQPYVNHRLFKVIKYKSSNPTTYGVVDPPLWYNFPNMAYRNIGYNEVGTDDINPFPNANS